MTHQTNTAATKDEAKPALVPKLRFPEFRGEGWTEKPLKAAANINPANKGLPESFIYIDLESVEAGKLKVKNRIFRVGSPSRAQRLVERGDIIFQIVRPYQRNNLLCEFDDDDDYVASTGYVQLRANGSNRFLYQSIHTDAFVGRVMAKCTGSNYPAINSSDLSDIRLPLPATLSEQQKIADCLSSVDELIAAQARKVEALKTHKKGLMQQLFPREGETQPRLRFPEFQNVGEWEVSELGSISDVRDGTHDSPSFFQTGRPLVTSKNLRPDGTLDLENVSLISEEDYEQINKRSKVSVGDILFGMIGTIGNPVQIKSAGFAIKNVALIKEVGSLSNAFLVQLLQSEYAAAIFAVLNTGNSQKFIALGKIRVLQVPVPSILEQQRIASCLTSLDALITAAAQALGTLKIHKKALMQQLFPALNETPT